MSAVAQAAAEFAIPMRFQGLLPVATGETEEDRAILWRGLVAPNARGASWLGSVQRDGPWGRPLPRQRPPSVAETEARQEYERAMMLAEAMSGEQGPSVLLCGHTGAGKTALAALMLRTVAIRWSRDTAGGNARTDAPAVWLGQSDAVHLLRTLATHSSQSRFAALCRASVLVIDRDQCKGLALCDVLVQARMTYRLPTIVVMESEATENAHRYQGPGDAAAFFAPYALDFGEMAVQMRAEVIQVGWFDEKIAIMSGI